MFLRSYKKEWRGAGSWQSEFQYSTTVVKIIWVTLHEIPFLPAWSLKQTDLWWSHLSLLDLYPWVLSVGQGRFLGIPSLNSTARRLQGVNGFESTAADHVNSFPPAPLGLGRKPLALVSMTPGSPYSPPYIFIEYCMWLFHSWTLDGAPQGQRPT